MCVDRRSPFWALLALERIAAGRRYQALSENLDCVRTEIGVRGETIKELEEQISHLQSQIAQSRSV
jgi:hypothetical protein